MKAEQLRKSILQLAIQGKLVPQDPNDEPASVLLERIRAEKQRLIKEGKIKKDKYDSVIFKGDDNRHYEKVGSEVKDITDDLPFEIPDSWVWCHLGNFVLTAFSGKSPKYSKEPTPHKIVGQQANQWDGLDLRFVKYATEEFAENIPPYYYLQDGDVLLNTLGNGTLGRSSYYRKTNSSEFLLTDGHIFVFRTLDRAMSYYLKIYLKNKYDEIVKSANGSTNQTFLSLGKTLQWFIPVPPLTELARIVAEIEKFEPLIAEYDKLEQQATKLDEEIYDQLKKSILQYAIQGKLVPQDPNEEPASVLIERIRAEKKAKLGKKYVDSFIYKGDDNCYYEHITGRAQDELVEIPFDIPDNWTWAKLLDLGGFSSGKTPDMSEPTYWQNGNVQWFTSKDMKTKYLTKSQLKITELAAGDMTLYPAKTLLWVVRSGILKSSLPICILKQPATINQDIKAYQLYQSDMIDYVYYILKGMEAIILDNYVKRITTVHSLKFDELISKLAIPIPPLAEQNRIVAKINEIFAML